MIRHILRAISNRLPCRGCELYQYQREGGKPVEWWRTARRGREVRK